MSIFISIASYRDPQLIPTIADCVARARYPHELHFGICWQHGPGEDIPGSINAGMRVIPVPWRLSRGACWARANIMELWDKEDWYLQLDSHHRFVDDWDIKLITDAERCGTDRPLLTSYVMPFNPAVDTLPPGEAMQMDYDYFTNDHIPLFRPRTMPDWRDLHRPLRARFVSAHFLFAPGRFVKDVPYDPELYFHGEEIMLAIRAFTHGYSLFHPAQHLMWHEYTRNYRVKHWDDHIVDNAVDAAWHSRDAVSRSKVRQFLFAPDISTFGCGTQRSFADYERYAGLNFVEKTAQPATVRGEEPEPIADAIRQLV